MKVFWKEEEKKLKEMGYIIKKVIKKSKIVETIKEFGLSIKIQWA